MFYKCYIMYCDCNVYHPTWKYSPVVAHFEFAVLQFTDNLYGISCKYVNPILNGLFHIRLMNGVG